MSCPRRTRSPGASRPIHRSTTHCSARERREAIRQAILRLPAHERRLVALLLREPDLTYQEVSAMLSIPKGSIGPTRGRCIARLRGDRHLLNVITGRPQPGHDLA